MPTLTKTCKQNPEHQFIVTNEDQAFYEKMKVPPPSLCPDCRVQRRMSFRNFRNLYERKCDLTGKQIISMYAPVPKGSAKWPSFPVYDTEAWWGDKWDAEEYATSYDFNRPFFDQIGELMVRVPKFSVQNVNSENCHYSNLVMSSRNCYLVFGCVKNEDCYYGHIVWESKNCLDCLYVLSCELCYQCVDCLKSYNLKYCQDAESCFDCSHCLDCKNCNNCFGCAGLRDKEHYIFNEPYGKEEYEKKIKEFDFCNASHMKKIREIMKALSMKHPHPHMHASNIENCSGDYIYNSKNVIESYDVKRSEDLKYAYTIKEFTDARDVNFSGSHSELVCDSITVEGTNIRFSHLCLNGNENITYSDSCFGCKNCFGCVGLRNISYAILNKSYSKEEYEDLVPRIIRHMEQTGEWGEFFPIALSPFGYNETIASEYFPLGKEEAAALGGKWREEKREASYYGAEYRVPDDIGDVPDDMCSKILKCEVTGKYYKIIPHELAFYRTMKLPVPKQCFEARHRERMLLKNPRRLWDRKCMKCKTPIRTTYAPERPEAVYCEKCYLNAVL